MKAASPPSNKVHFSITGEFITEFSRDRMFEAGWEYALRFLVEDIIGFTHDDAVAVLRGGKCLVGTNEIVLKPEENKTQQKLITRLNWHYAGIVFNGKSYFRPYAYVDNWGEEDLEGNYKRDIPGLGFSGGKDGIARSLHYGNKSDVCFLLEYNDSTVAVLWENVTAPPPWMRIYNNLQWQVALEEYLTEGNRKLEHRGNQQWYPHAKAEPHQPHPPMEEPEFEPPSMPEPDKELVSDSGYVTSDGTFYPCAYNGHRDLADALVYHLVNKNESNPQHRADVLGWVKLGVSLLSNKVDVFHLGDMALTEQQVHTLLEWHHKHKVELPYWWEDAQPK